MTPCIPSHNYTPADDLRNIVHLLPRRIHTTKISIKSLKARCNAARAIYPIDSYGKGAPYRVQLCKRKQCGVLHKTAPVAAPRACIPPLWMQQRVGVDASPEQYVRWM